ncbi:MAG: [FeFe] hydrogenase H-cluster radical SAM maturase HydE [Oligosphaeraceae bacterium]
MTDTTARHLIDRLADGARLCLPDWRRLLDGATADDQAHAAHLANDVRQRVFGNAIYIRGLVEFSNFCRCNCLYCGIRRDNRDVRRYRLSDAQILGCLEDGYAAGFRTLVLQGGEDAHATDDWLCGLLQAIKSRHPDVAVTLSVGERSRESYRHLREAGADRYLLRHETASPEHYARLHPADQTFDNRMRCLRDLQELGFQVGCGFMVGSPFQDTDCLARDLHFIQEFRPQMVGIGPFIPHHATPFRDEPPGSIDTTLLLLSLLRLSLPKLLLPATTALATLDPRGRERGILAGANVVMPNLSPREVRDSYALYDHKANSGCEAAEGLQRLRDQLRAIGSDIVVSRGDAPS